jgi:hypothetical protein
VLRLVLVVLVLVLVVLVQVSDDTLVLPLLLLLPLQLLHRSFLIEVRRGYDVVVSCFRPRLFVYR